MTDDRTEFPDWDDDDAWTDDLWDAWLIRQIVAAQPGHHPTEVHGDE